MQYAFSDYVLFAIMCELAVVIGLLTVRCEQHHRDILKKR